MRDDFAPEITQALRSGAASGTPDYHDPGGNHSQRYADRHRERPRYELRQPLGIAIGTATVTTVSGQDVAVVSNTGAVTIGYGI